MKKVELKNKNFREKTMKIVKSKTSENYYVEWLKSKIFLSIARIKNKKNNVNILKGVRLNSLTKFEDNIYVYPDCDLRATSVGRGTYISKNTSLPFSSIGRFAQIGSNVEVIAGDHLMKDNISTHPAFYSNLGQAGFIFTEKSTYPSAKVTENNKLLEIGNDVWIGSNVQILNGIKIGDGCVIATGAVVTKNLEPYTIYGGVPAKKIRTRFEKEDIEFLLSNPWFDFDLDFISKNREAFNNIESYKKLIIEKNRI